MGVQPVSGLSVTLKNEENDQFEMTNLKVFNSGGNYTLFGNLIQIEQRQSANLSELEIKSENPFAH